MIAAERRAVGTLAVVIAVRMLGLFLLLPVVALHATGLPGATPLLVGLAVGSYGITQALLQIPLGSLSDRVGRRSVIVSGLLVMALGSVVAARADTALGLIGGRLLQGTGAISAAVTALIADLTRPQVRTRAMAIVGVTIGSSFVLSLLLGPALGAWMGVRGIFWLAAGLAASAALLVAVAVPSGRRGTPARASTAQLGRVLRDPQLQVLNGGILLLHLMLTACFVGLPLLLRDELGLAAERHWQIYLAAMLCSLLGTVPLVLWVERSRRPRRIVLLALGCLLAGLALLLGGPGAALVVSGLAVFFAGFNFMEAWLPAEISRLAPEQGRGAAMGVYASAQFLGAFAGGALGGMLMAAAGARGVFVLGGAAALLWLGLMLWPRSGARG